MGTTVLAPQVLDRDGAELALSAANEDGHTIANNGRMFIVFTNGSAANCEVTIATPGQVDGLDIEELVVDVVLAETWVIGPFPPAIYNTDPGTTDVITATFEDHEDMTLAAVVMPVN